MNVDTVKLKTENKRLVGGNPPVSFSFLLSHFSFFESVCSLFLFAFSKFVELVVCDSLLWYLMVFCFSDLQFFFRFLQQHQSSKPSFQNFREPVDRHTWWLSIDSPNKDLSFDTPCVDRSTGQQNRSEFHSFHKFSDFFFFFSPISYLITLGTVLFKSGGGSY